MPAGGHAQRRILDQPALAKLLRAAPLDVRVRKNREAVEGDWTPETRQPDRPHPEYVFAQADPVPHRRVAGLEGRVIALAEEAVDPAIRNRSGSER